MSMQSDWLKVMKARRQVEDAMTLPERFRASCCYSDECRAFCESYRFVLGLIVGTSKLPTDRAA